MVTTEQHQIVEARLAAISPVFDVMRIDEPTVATAGKTTAAVTAF